MARHGTPAELRLLYPIVSSFDDPRADELLAAAVRRLGNGEVPAAAQAELLDATLRRGTPQVAAAIKQLHDGWSAGSDRLAPFRSALEAGDATAGRQLFMRHPKLACLQCHEVERADAGPSLAGIGALRSKESLLESVVFPQATVTPGYRSTMPEGVGEILTRRELRDLITYLTELRGATAPAKREPSPR
jgi:mono/diheme cytochrome c family protein